MKFYVFAFSTAETRLCRTLVRRRVVFRRFCIFFISPQATREPKTAQTYKVHMDTKKHKTKGPFLNLD